MLDLRATARLWALPQHYIKEKKGATGGGTREQINMIFGSVKQRNSKSQAVEGVGGGALQQGCASCSLSLIGSLLSGCSETRMN